MTLGVKMIAGFLAAIAGIALWAHTRKPSWIFIILATIVSYIDILCQFFDRIGVFSLDLWTVGGIPVLQAILAAAGPLLYAVGLFLEIRNFLKP